MLKVSVSGVILGGIIDVALSLFLGAVFAQWALAAVVSIGGGYAAAAMARHDHVLNGTLSSIFYIALGVLVWMTGIAKIPAWEHIAALIVSPAFGALGGYIRANMKRGNAPVRTA